MALAQGVRREAETIFARRPNASSISMDVGSREEFEAVRDSGRQARTENERLAQRIAALETKLGGASGAADRPLGRGVGGEI
jgi:BMFP domain-containing protein YqiC